MTGYGLTGPMTEMGTVFAPKDAGGGGGGGAVPLLPIMGVGCWLLFCLL